MSTTDDRPTDTIRDAFEAMLAFLRLLMTPWKMPLSTDPQLAIEAARILGSWPNSPHMWNLSDLIQRAAEEHNRRANTGGDWTPERIREARERCAEIERRYQAGLESASNREDLALTVLAIRAAREDLPAALAEIERLNRLVVATANADPSWVERCTTQAAEIERLATALQAERAAWQEASGADSPGHLTAALKARRARLTAELAARVPALFDGPPRTLYQPNGPDGRPEDAGAPADASLEARAWPQRGLTRAEFDKRLAFIVSDMSSEDAAWLRSRLASYAGWETDPGRWAAIAAIEGAAEGSGMRFARMRDLSEALVGLAVVRAVDASRPAAAIERTLNINALARCARAALRIEVPDVVAWEALPEAERVGWRAVVRCILASTTLASRPGLTEEQAREIAADVAMSFNARWSIGLGQGPIKDMAARIEAGVLRASRGETGPAADLGPGIDGAPIRVRPTAAPNPLAFDPEDGTLCADCRAPRNTIHGALCSVRAGAKPGRVPDPRATLHAGDPASPFAPGSLAAGSATEDRILDRKRGGK